MKTRHYIIIVIIFLLGITIGRCFTIFGTGFINRIIPILFIGLVITTIIISIIIWLIAKNKDYILSKLFNITDPSIKTLTTSTNSLVDAIKNNELEEVKTHTDKLIRKMIAAYSWYNLSSWVHRVFLILLAAFSGFLGTVLLYRQNQLFEKQNVRLDQQTYLEEADRRSSLVFLMSNVFDKIDDELKDSINNRQRKLSPQLIGRIVSLSQSLKPYKYLDKDILTSKIISPEKGQLLNSIINSNIDKQESLKSILEKVDFSYAELNGSNLEGIYLEGGNFEKASLVNANLVRVNLSKANLKGADLSGANLAYANLTGTDLTNCSLKGANLYKANFKPFLFKSTTLSGREIVNSAIPTNVTNIELDSAKCSSEYLLDSLSTWEMYGLESIYHKYEINEYPNKKEYINGENIQGSYLILKK